MSYRRRGGSRASSRYNVTNIPATRKNYVSEQSGSRRHEFVLNTSAADVTGVYKFFNMAKFKRTFDAGVTNDVNPTASDSNNYATAAVMNGSKISHFASTWMISNNSTSVPCYIDVYVIALSFFDGLIWNTLQAATCPITFDVAGGAGDDRGVIGIKTPAAGLITAQNYRSFTHIQHYMKQLGTVFLAANDGSPSSQSFTLNRLPAKCRRSQTGMVYAIFFVNDTVKNNSATIDYKVNATVSFLETPSDNRIPYVN